MILRRLTALLAVSVIALAAWSAIAPFTATPGSDLPSPWRRLFLPGVKASEIALASDGGATVLQVRSVAAAGSASHPIDKPPIRPQLAWRWKVDRIVEAADLETRAGDDFAARVYVFFDVDPADLPLAARIKYFFARLLHGDALPTTAICYVWDNRHPIGTSKPNPYTERVQTVVLESGRSRIGKWKTESRDLDADFRAAFRWDSARAVPRVTGIAAGNDTDQTGESVTAWFADFTLGSRP